LHHGRYQAALAAFGGAWETSSKNQLLVTFNSWVLTDYVACLRASVNAPDVRQADADKRLIQKWYKMARWAYRLSMIIVPERPHALRELALANEHRGRLHKAWKLAAKSCRVAEGQKAKYEYAQSLLVCGRLARRLGRPEGADQIAAAEAEISRIEESIS